MKMKIYMKIYFMVRQLCKIDSRLDLDTVQTYRFPFREYIVQHDKGCAILKW
jgi:hypothetical protein